MTDSDFPRLVRDDEGVEPGHDPQLAGLLREGVGTVPAHEVQWQVLAQRIMSVVRQPRPTPWWSYAEKWERRVIPIALAAGILGAVALWSLGASPSSATTSADLLTAVVDGTPVTDATATYANLLVGTADPVAGVPE